MTRLAPQTSSISGLAPRRLLVVEDHPLFRAALVEVIHAALSDVEILQASTIEGALDVVSGRDAVDIVMLDLSIPGTTGLMGAIRVRRSAPKSALVIISAHDDTRIVGTAMSLGISGYIPKSTPRSEMIRMIRGIMDGKVCVPRQLLDSPAARQAHAVAQALLRELSVLTTQQLCILDMLGRGLQNKQIAHELDISVTTVKVHVTEVLRKLCVRSRTEAIIKVALLELNDGARRRSEETEPSDERFHEGSGQHER